MASITISTSSSAEAEVAAPVVDVSEHVHECAVASASHNCTICANTEATELELRAHKLLLKQTEAEHKAKLALLVAEKKSKELELQTQKREHNTKLIADAQAKLLELEGALSAQQALASTEISNKTAALDLFLESSAANLNALHVERMAEFSAHEAKVKEGLVDFSARKVAITHKLEADLVAIDEDIKKYTLEQQAKSNDISVTMQNDVSLKKEANATAEEDMKNEIAEYTTKMATEANALKLKLEAAQNELTVIRAHRIQMDAFFNAKQAAKVAAPVEEAKGGIKITIG